MSAFEEAVRGMSGPDLAELIAALGHGAEDHRFSGQLLGVCLQDAVARLKGGNQ